MAGTPADAPAEEEIQKSEGHGRREREPRDHVKDCGEAMPPEQHPQRCPAEEVVVLAEHDEEHARAYFPRGNTVAAAQVDCDRAFAHLLVDDGEDVGAGADGQHVGVPKPHVEPADHAPDHDAVDQDEECAVGDHQCEPPRPAHVLENADEVGAEPLALGRSRPIQPAVEIDEAGRGDEPWQEALPPPAASRGRGGRSAFPASRERSRPARPGTQGCGPCPRRPVGIS